MKSRILCLILAVLGLTPPLPAQALNRIPAIGGSLTGTITTPAGPPAQGVRIAAMDTSELPGNDTGLGMLVSIAETDENGRFLLENIPPGRYLITAGRVDIPTYYPGTTDRSQAKVISISSAANIIGIDFIMDDGSIRLYNSPFSMSVGPPLLSVSVPVDVKVEGGGVPVFAFGKFPAVVLKRKTDGYPVEIRLNEASIDVPLTGMGISEYRVSVENLPEGYVVKSLQYGSSDVSTETIKLTPPPGTSAAYATQAAAYYAALAATGRTPQNSAATVILPPAAQAPATGQSTSLLPISTLSVTLAAAPVSRPPSGVRITGKAISTGVRSVYISGIPGIYFADGSFEFRGVPAGRQVILLFDQDSVASGPRGMWIVMAGLSVAVGDRDIGNVELEPITMLPPDTSSLMSLGPATTHASGPIPMSVIRGRVEDDAGQSLGGGTVTIAGQSRRMIRIGADGRFEIPHLLPGTYDLEIGNFAHETVRRSIQIEEQDVELKVSAARL